MAMDILKTFDDSKEVIIFDKPSEIIIDTITTTKNLGILGKNRLSNHNVNMELIQKINIVIFYL